MKNSNKLLSVMLCSFVILAAASLIVVSFWCKQDQGNEEWKDFERVLDSNEVIIDGVISQSTAFTIISTGGRTDYGNLFVVFRQGSDKKWQRDYTNDFEDLKPWKIELGDVDGDGTVEVLIAVKKTTHFDIDEKNRMFIFNYDGEKLIKKWTGSLTAGEWNDFMVGNLLSIKGDELIFIEQAENGEEHLSVYYWFDFGFALLAESENYKDIVSLSIIEENRIQIAYDKKQNIITTLTVQNGKIVQVGNE